MADLLKQSNKILIFVLLHFFVFVPSVLKAQESSSSQAISPPSSNSTKAPTLPKTRWEEILQNKQKLSETDLTKKRALGYFLPIPLLAYDPDIGWGGGLRLYYYSNGKRNNPLFPYVPYVYRAFAQVFLTSKNVQFSLLDLDSPYLWGTLFRLRSRIILAKSPTSNYFRLGNRSLARFRLPTALQTSGAPRSFSRLVAFDKKLQKILPNGEIYTKYYKYAHEVTSWQLTLEHDFFGGIFRALGGFRFEKTTIKDYTGTRVSTAGGKKGIMGKTLLREDHEAGRIRGFRGGMDNVIKLGIAYDTRDYEPAPKKGLFADVVFEWSESGIGSDFDYTRAMAAVRGYYSPFPKKAKLVLAGRGLYYGFQGGVPFSNLATISDTQGKFRGLGGRRTLRGYKQDRFVGKVGALLNFELRWDFAEWELSEHHFDFLFTPFVDLGRVFDDTKETTLNHWKKGEGLGLRTTWNQATVIALEYGWSHEYRGVYLLFNHTF